MASAGDDKTVCLWNTATGELKKTITEHTDAIWSVIFSPNGQTLASGSSDETIRLWNTATGELRKTITGYTGRVFSLAFSPDGTILLWDLISTPNATDETK